jgi:hypothetical protein
MTTRPVSLAVDTVIAAGTYYSNGKRLVCVVSSVRDDGMVLVEDCRTLQTELLTRRRLVGWREVIPNAG